MGIVAKLLGVILVITGCAGCGWYIANEARVRISILQELQQGILILQGEMEYAGDDLEEILSNLSRKSAYFSEFFSGISQKLCQKENKSLYVVWQEEVKESSLRKRLKEEDLLFLEELGKNLGNLDRQTQLHTLQVMLQRLDKQIKQAGEEY